MTILRIVVVGGGLLLLTLIGLAFWFIVIPVGVVALIIVHLKTRQKVKRAKAEFWKFIDEPH